MSLVAEEKGKTDEGSKVEKATSPVDLVATKFIEKDGHIRKIVHLWGSYYRVNYHEVAKSNYITESHFVHVVDGSIQVN